MQNIDDDIRVGSTKVNIVLCGAWMKEDPVHLCVYTKARVSCILRRIIITQELFCRNIVSYGVVGCHQIKVHYTEKISILGLNLS